MTEPLLRIQNVSKTFPGQKALDGVSFDVNAGEVHALIGHNGSGKSTLIKILAGYHLADSGGRAVFDGDLLELDRQRSASPKMHFVHQGLGLVDDLNAVDNIALGTGYVRRPWGTVHWSRQAAATRDALGRVGIELDIWAPVRGLAPVERTAIAIARAISQWQGDNGLLVLDEPTAALPPRDVDRLFEILDELRAAGVAIIYVSHRLDEILRVSDQITVLRGGKCIGTRSRKSSTRRVLIQEMVGEDVEVRHVEAATEVTGVPLQRREGTPVLEVRELCSAELRNVTLTVSQGEILGVAGLLGSGREELPYALVGVTPSQGRVWFCGEQLRTRSPRGLRNLGVGLVPGDRATQGIVHHFDVRENMTLPTLRSHRRNLLVNRASENRFAQRWVTELDIRPPRLTRDIQTLSGGNQQKVVLAKWLGRDPRLLILDEPTAGVDISTREAIYDLVRERAREGTSFIVCTSDVEDLVAVCDRVLVLRDGGVAIELTPPLITEAQILTAMLQTGDRAPEDVLV